ncbi:succinate dehydrogenase / fumarate reductase cytochrome b subunit [Lutibacter agarilyticus]|uniref:Succinate dehydrogenase / fumarate reductase cytochrome b subunit n=1 Tax=Lutibacter agarilyticus TaxID=1109740 RepID=A0A238XEX1_9FLAO|nr:succinate dehydrogenase cytochrome b subunit [Lutibacter agarilyticus]SNR57033.1 succinate dehydrogenase / fumarate reductase cytochrome b subunit [Lutibacter agarilyticus]
MSGFLSSSIARKVAMALSALFLIIFLIIHLAVNLTSLFSADAFNEASHFMGTNPVIQFAMQPVLIFGVVFHFVMGFVLELRNKGARNVKYAKFNGAASSTWMSRNMVVSGAVILAFIVIHFLDFWIPELNTKYVLGDMSGVLPGEEGYRYFAELQHKFVPVWRVAAYVVAFVLLGLHLAHGFQSAFQSMGFNNKYTKCVKTLGVIYSVVIPLGFIIVALFHHFNH